MLFSLVHNNYKQLKVSKVKKKRRKINQKITFRLKFLIFILF